VWLLRLNNYRRIGRTSFLSIESRRSQMRAAGRDPRCPLVNSTVAVFLLLTALVIPNLVAIVCLMQSAVYSATQRALQLMLVWVIPLVGPVFVWAGDSMGDNGSHDGHGVQRGSSRPQASKDSRKLVRLSGLETGTVFGTVSLENLEPLAEEGGKTSMKSMVGVTGFEPATPTSRT
jgi:hypothetical protein